MKVRGRNLMGAMDGMNKEEMEEFVDDTISKGGQKRGIHYVDIPTGMSKKEAEAFIDKTRAKWDRENWNFVMRKCMVCGRDCRVVEQVWSGCCPECLARIPPPPAPFWHQMKVALLIFLIAFILWWVFLL